MDRLALRRADERGSSDHGWLLSRHTFSFADYHDPEQMGFRSLRVLNEDIVQPGRGFGAHPHREMEIISYLLDGALEHSDSMGSGGVIRPGEVQRMSAGTGIVHSEYNHSEVDPVHFLQIWIEPSERGLTPSYEQRHFAEQEKRGRWRLLASEDGRDGSVVVHQDVKLYAALIDGERPLHFTPSAGRHVWLQVARGDVTASGHLLRAGDALFGSTRERLVLSGGHGGEVLLFDLA